LLLSCQKEKLLKYGLFIQILPLGTKLVKIGVKLFMDNAVNMLRMKVKVVEHHQTCLAIYNYSVFVIILRSLF